MAQQKVKINLDGLYAPEDREAIAEDIIQHIIERTREKKRGFDPDTGKEFSLSTKPYSKSYAKSKGTNIRNVDLTLSTDMLDAITRLTGTSRSITIGFEAGSKENDKAEGNQKGTYGQRSGDPKKARPFLGISESALNKILEKYERKR